MGPVNDTPALVQVMDWHRTADQSLSEPIMAQFIDAYMRHSVEMIWRFSVLSGFEEKLQLFKLTETFNWV